jgi:sporulation protein YlmC with PRC-barrel domain
VANEEKLRELEEKYEGYKVYDNRGEKIGKVDDLFIDETDREEYIGVKMGFLGRKSTLIPMDIVRVNEADRTIEVSESKDHVKNAPSFDDDEDITHEYEERIRSHFGLQSMEPSQIRSSYGAYSSAGDEEHEGEWDYSDRGGRTDHESSTVDTEYGERASTAAGAPATDEGREGTETGDTYSGAGEEGSRRDPVEDRMRESAARSSETSSGDTGSRDIPEYETGTTESRGAQESGEAETQRTPISRQTEETETFEEGGRTKVRRRIIREEIVEEDANDRSS